MNQKPTFHFGIYKGIGDFVGALVAVASAKSECDFVIYTYGNVENVVPFVKPHNVKIVSLGNVSRIQSPQIFRFFWSLVVCRPTIYFVSDFSVSPFSLSKLFQLIVCRLLFVRVAGSSDDKFSPIYSIKLPSTKHVELIRKDYFFLSSFIELFSIDDVVCNLGRSIIEPTKKYRYVIHIGASTFNKRLGRQQVREFISKFTGYDCAVIGTKEDFLNASLIKDDFKVDFLITSFNEMLSLIKYCEVFVGYDSAAANIANLFSRRLHLISGPANSESLYQISSRITIHRSNAKCQACGQPFCSKGSVLCMDGFDPDHLFESIFN